MGEDAVSEVVLSTGEALRVSGTPAEVEALVTAAARGSYLDLAWLEDAATGEPIGVNPEHVAVVRASRRPGG